MPGTADREAHADPWAAVPARLRARGLRWTPQRRLLAEVLAGSRGHVTGADLVERCRRVDPETTASTVYRTMDVLEELGLVRHGHGADGREEYHVLPESEHGHLYCRICGRVEETEASVLARIEAALAEGQGFVADRSHVTIVGTCAGCRGRTASTVPGSGAAAAGVGPAR